MKKLYVRNSSNFRFSAQEADGTSKRISKSETLCLGEVKSFCQTLRSVVHHFQCSVERKELLQGIDLISWCKTKMDQFLTASEKLNELLVSLCNMMYSSNMSYEERDKLFCAENMYTL